MDFERFYEHLENSNSKQKDANCEQYVNVGWGRPLHHKASMYSMCQDINLTSVPSVGQRTGSSYSTTDKTDLADWLLGRKRSKSFCGLRRRTALGLPS